VDFWLDTWTKFCPVREGRPGAQDLSRVLKPVRSHASPKNWGCGGATFYLGEGESKCTRAVGLKPSTVNTVFRKGASERSATIVAVADISPE
jgi:hypothetical protein